MLLRVTENGTKALAITKDSNVIKVTKKNSRLLVVEGKGESLYICSFHRIGVKRDLPRKLRFFIEGDKFVSEF